MVARNQSALSAQHGSSDEDEVSATEGGPPGEAAPRGTAALSESVLSEESSIFNALRTNSGTEDIGPRLGPGCPSHGNADSRIAANMAMFIPLAPEATDAVQRLNREPKYFPEQKAQSSGWHPQLSLDSCALSTDEGKAIVASPPDDSLKQHLLDALHLRKAVSLNDADDISRTFKWPGNHDSPVNPVLPSYPPPVRAPTPPGLPSFGTREAICYSAQFPVRSATISGQVQQPAPNSARNACRRVANGTRTGSYGGMLRRLLSFSSSTPSQPKRQVYIMARAEDGTAVQGRFPYRQSGHGMNLARRLDDHPFHRTAVSTVQEDHVNIDAGVRQTDGDRCDSKQEQADIAEPSNLGAGRRMQRARPQIALNSLLPLPRPVLADNPQRPVSANPSLPTCRVDSFYTCASHSQVPGMSRHMDTLDTQGTERLGDTATCFLAPTQSPPVSTAQEGCRLANDHSGPWLQSLRIVNSWFFCCLGARNEQDTVIYSNTASNDTYVTARSHASNDSAAECIRPGGPEDPVQSPRRWLSETWMSLQMFASRNFLALSPMPP
ncbi:uncharacterized protein BO80DRAFT_448216 [Aspergillus ibericus CBS 121593]|uniref:Uncharacterized protein n=1 Tax=Aspergillus ibericus CBS 121593 TaxID=1448316 RepID=A0A395GSC0_9EURO|nr:hypothetical protein BO80DRAFT_448216 [Aspergillus ibericus CBS 121593]RAK97607.1 hypothetical protein BO80DRAFT_448216 [Aspergillus ibericus CBS 121593]